MSKNIEPSKSLQDIEGLLNEAGHLAGKGIVADPDTIANKKKSSKKDEL